MEQLVSVPGDETTRAQHIGVHALGAPMAHVVHDPAVAAVSISQVCQATQVVAKQFLPKRIAERLPLLHGRELVNELANIY
jgi:hypothetical protein